MSKFFALKSRDTAGKWPDFVDDLEIRKFIRAQKCIRAKGPEWSHYSAYKGRDFRSYSNLRHDESLLLAISGLGSRMNLSLPLLLVMVCGLGNTKVNCLSVPIGQMWTSHP